MAVYPCPSTQNSTAEDAPKIFSRNFEGQIFMFFIKKSNVPSYNGITLPRILNDGTERRFVVSVNSPNLFSPRKNH